MDNNNKTQTGGYLPNMHSTGTHTTLTYCRCKHTKNTSKSTHTHPHTCRSGFIVCSVHTHAQTHRVVSVEGPVRWQHCWPTCYQVSVNTHIILYIHGQDLHSAGIGFTQYHFPKSHGCRAVTAAIISSFFFKQRQKRLKNRYIFFHSVTRKKKCFYRLELKIKLIVCK